MAADRGGKEAMNPAQTQGTLTYLTASQHLQ